MDKKIEYLSHAYSEYCFKSDPDLRGSSNLAKIYKPMFYDDAKRVLIWLFSRNIIDRMTAEEEKRLREEYAKTHPSDPDRCLSGICIENALKRIFSPNFFKDNPND